MKWGDKIETLQEHFKTSGKMPPALEERPFIVFPLDTYFKSFLKLIRRRQAGYASGQAFTPTDIILFALSQHYEDDLEFFIRLVSELDDHYLEWQADRAKEQREQDKLQNKGAGKSRPRQRGKR